MVKTEGAKPAHEKNFLKYGNTVKFILAVVTALTVYSIFTHARVSRVISLTPGQMSPSDIYAAADFRFVDEEMTARNKETAAEAVIPVYVIDGNLIEESVKKISKFLNDISNISKDPNISFDEKLKKAKEVSPGKISEEDLSVLIAADIDKETTDNVVDLYRKITKNGIMRQDDKVKIIQETGDRLNVADRAGGSMELRPVNSVITLEDVDNYVFWKAKEYFGSLRFVRSVTNYLLDYTGVTLVYDKEKTDLLKKEAMSGVGSEYSYVKKGQIIIRKGEEVTKRHLAEMKSMAETEARSLSKEEKWHYRLGMILIIAIMMILFVDYLKYHEPRVFEDNSKLLLISILFIAAVGASKSVLYVNERFEMPWMKFIVLVPFASILYAILVNQRVAFILTAALSLFLGIMNANRLDFLMLGIAGGAAGIISSKGTKHRWQILKVGFIIGVANIILLLAFQVMGDFDPYIFFRHAVSGMTGGLICALLAGFFIPTFEYLFNIPTDLKLLEFLDLNHPLLKEMVIKAPGTYHHSLMVGNLAEAAASAIGANPLLAKVAAYFHDIGKSLKPEYFSENEEYGKSFHKGLNPSMSSLIILSHVKDGVDLAKKYKLPGIIIDILKEHHGTSLVYYFYKKAEKTAEEGNVIEEENYRYKGPAPRSKESGIVLIADAVEAASRSLEKPTPSRIENLVKEIIDDKINDHQLEGCDLTLSEISVISEVFNRVLIAAYHSRIKYPKEEQEIRDEKQI